MPPANTLVCSNASGASNLTSYPRLKSQPGTADLSNGIGMRLKLIAFVCLCTAIAPAGELAGKIILTKKITKKSVAPVAYNIRGAVVANRPVVPSTEYTRMVVVLEGKPGGRPEPVNAVLDQRGGRFEPELLLVPAGSTVSFPNFDPIFHNVFSLSKAKQFDLGYYPEGQTRKVKFEKAGVVQVYCHIHSNMYAAIVITDSPWQAKPNDEGSFSITEVPAGTYQVLIWHNAAGVFRREVQISETGVTPFRLEIPVEVARH